MRPHPIEMVVIRPPMLALPAPACDEPAEPACGEPACPELAEEACPEFVEGPIPPLSADQRRDMGILKETLHCASAGSSPLARNSSAQ